MTYGIRLRIFSQKRNHSRRLVGRIVPYRKVIDGILRIKNKDANGKCCPKNMVLVLPVIVDFRNGIDRYIQKSMDKITENL